MEPEAIKINDLVAEFYDELNQRNYDHPVKMSYHKVCSKILDWCKNNQIDSLDEKTGNRFCDETIGGHLSKKGSTYEYRKTLRVTRMLVTLLRDGDFETRSPSIEYEFRTPLRDVIEDYLNYCTVVRKLSPSSISQRKTAVFRFDLFLFAIRKSTLEITGELFEDFLSQHCSENSRRTYKPIFRDLYRYLFENAILDKDYSTLIWKEPKVAKASKLPTTYTEEEIKRMIKAIDRSSAKGKRDYLVLLLAAEYGWRSSDITSFRLDQIDWEKNKIVVIQKKTGVPVEFPLLASVGNAVIDYLRHGRPAEGGNEIIVNHENTHKGKRLTSATIHSIVSQALKAANIKNWKTKKHGPHTLRHSLASNMLKNNVSLPIIKTVLGHQSTESTKTYMSIDLKELRLCSLPIPSLRSSHYRIKTK